MTRFAPMPDRLVGELDARIEMGRRALPYSHAYLDDCLRAICPSDLVLVVAWSGVGKTQLVYDIAAQSAAEGRRVHVFALEAEKRELERRRKFALISRLALQHERYKDLNFKDWKLGRCEHVAGEYDAEADEIIKRRYSTLYTLYRTGEFTAEDLVKQIGGIREQTDLMVVDHLHYIDEDASLSEQRALYATVKTIRDCVQVAERPILLVAHLRKKDRGAKQLVPDLDDVHGTSNVVKVCTHVVAIAPARDVKARWWWQKPTYVAVLKDRDEGVGQYVAVQNFDVRTRSYETTYTLGEIHGSKWAETPLLDVPRWARNHRQSESQTAVLGATDGDDHPNAPGAT